jgi:hypothetical protein
MRRGSRFKASSAVFCGPALRPPQSLKSPIFPGIFALAALRLWVKLMFAESRRARRKARLSTFLTQHSFGIALKLETAFLGLFIFAQAHKDGMPQAMFRRPF